MKEKDGFGLPAKTFQAVVEIIERRNFAVA